MIPDAICDTVAPSSVAESAVQSLSYRHLALAIVATAFLLHPLTGHTQETPTTLACPEPALAPRIGPMPDRSAAPSL